jgi:hypothetical protein
VKFEIAKKRVRVRVRVRVSESESEYGEEERKRDLHLVERHKVRTSPHSFKYYCNFWRKNVLICDPFNSSIKRMIEYEKKNEQRIHSFSKWSGVE